MTIALIEKEVHQLAASKRFGGYKPMDESASRKPAVQKSEALERIEAAWQEFAPVWPRWTSRCAGGGSRLDTGFDDEFFNYETARGKVGGIRAGARDVKAFCLAIHRFQGEKDFSGKAGFFLSALIEESQEKRFTLHLGALDKRINYLGFMNHKELCIIGDVGNCLGAFNYGLGSIRLVGSAGCSAGMAMGGGTIQISGNAGRNLGGGFTFINPRCVGPTGEPRAFHYRMVGGKIILDGNTEERAGELMEGGEIHLNGDYLTLGHVSGGRIFHRGKLIRGK